MTPLTNNGKDASESVGSSQILIITRHAGLVDWLAARGISGRVIAHLSDGDVASGDIVIGALPVHLVAEITAIGAFYIHVRIDVPEGLRGQDLDGAALEQLDVSLVLFAATALSVSAMSHDLPAPLYDALTNASASLVKGERV